MVRHQWKTLSSFRVFVVCICRRVDFPSTEWLVYRVWRIGEKVVQWMAYLYSHTYTNAQTHITQATTRQYYDGIYACMQLRKKNGKELCTLFKMNTSCSMFMLSIFFFFFSVSSVSFSSSLFTLMLLSSFANSPYIHCQWSSKFFSHIFSLLLFFSHSSSFLYSLILVISFTRVYYYNKNP